MKRGSAELVSQFAEGAYLLSKTNHRYAFVCGSAVVMVIPLSSSRYEAFKRERAQPLFEAVEKAVQLS